MKLCEAWSRFVGLCEAGSRSVKLCDALLSSVQLHEALFVAYNILTLKLVSLLLSFLTSLLPPSLPSFFPSFPDARLFSFSLPLWYVKVQTLPPHHLLQARLQSITSRII